MSGELPWPPDVLEVEPNTEVWPAGLPIFRIHEASLQGTEFNPGIGGGRFHPFRDQRGEVVPTLYGSNTFEGALSETVFHNMPTAGPERLIKKSRLEHMSVSLVVPNRPLSLIQLRGFGLGKLGLTRLQLIESRANRYDRTRAWAALLYAHMSADGLIWMSRQHDSSAAIVLFGPRASAALDASGIAERLSLRAREVQAAAESAGITIT